MRAIESSIIECLCQRAIQSRHQESAIPSPAVNETNNRRNIYRTTLACKLRRGATTSRPRWRPGCSKPPPFFPESLGRAYRNGNRTPRVLAAARPALVVRLVLCGWGGHVSPPPPTARGVSRRCVRWALRPLRRAVCGERLRVVSPESRRGRKCNVPCPFLYPYMRRCILTRHRPFEVQ